MKLLIPIAFIAFLGYFLFQSFPEVAEYASQSASKVSQSVEEGIQKGVEGVNESVDKVSQSVEQGIQQGVDGVNDSLNKVSQSVQDGIQQGVDRVNAHIYQLVEPMFPWMFIIFFLLFFAALKAIIPFSDKVVIQLSLILISYLVSIKIFSSMGLLYHAFLGTLWLIMPFVLLGTIFYFFRERLAPIVARINSKLNEKMDSMQAKLQLNEAE